MRDDDRVGPGFSRIDQLIDVTVHAMTRGEPSDQLRAAVRARIERRRGWWAMVWWAPALVAAMLVIVVARTVSGPRGEPDTARPTAPLASANPGPQVGSTERPERPERLIVIEPLIVPLLAVDTSSGVMPIDIEPLQIEPLQPQ